MRRRKRPKRHDLRVAAQYWIQSNRDYFQASYVRKDHPNQAACAMSLMRRHVLLASELSSDLVTLWKTFCQGAPLYQSPFYWPQFTQAVARARSDVRIAIIEERGDVVGFLPFHLTRSGVGKPIGGQLNDYQGPILAPDSSVEPQVLLDAAGISCYDYNHLPLSFGKLTAEAHTRSISPQMDLSEGYDAFVARKGSSWTRAKKLMRRRYRKTEEQFGPIRFTFHNPEESAYRQHVAMKNALLERVGTRFRIAPDWIGDTLNHLRQMQEPEFLGVMTTLHAGDRLIAAHFGLRSSTIWHFWFSSYDLELYKLGPGINLVDHCAMAAQEHGLSAIDFGRGDADYKLLFADRKIELCEGSISRSGSMARLIRRGARSAVSVAERLPLGRHNSFPGRLAARFLSGVALPKNEPGNQDRVL